MVGSVGGTKTLIEHWDGTSWTRVPSPSPGPDASLWGVSATSADDAWAVGSVAYGSDGYTKTLIAHWDGTSWTRVFSPSPGGNDRLFAVSAVSATNAWVVGDTYDLSVRRTVAQSWNGTSWQTC